MHTPSARNGPVLVFGSLLGAVQSSLMSMKLLL
jgi:hypothetical protein